MLKLRHGNFIDTAGKTIHRKMDPVEAERQQTLSGGISGSIPALCPKNTVQARKRKRKCPAGASGRSSFRIWNADPGSFQLPVCVPRKRMETAFQRV